MEKRIESGASSGLKPVFSGFFINCYLKALQIINLRTLLSKKPEFELVWSITSPPIEF